MSAILMLVLIFAGVLMPENTSEFTAEMGSRKIAFIKQENGTWLSDKIQNGKKTGKTLGQFKINGLEIGFGAPGKEIPSMNMAEQLGVKSAEELKATTKITVANQNFAISKTNKGFLIHQGEKQVAKVSW